MSERDTQIPEEFRKKQGVLLYEMSRSGRRGLEIPASDVPPSELPAQSMLRNKINLPEVGQLEVVRYFLDLSQQNYGIESGTFPLGSCTMKYNPKVNDAAAGRFTETHPAAPEELVQGNLQIIYELQNMLAEITGMDATSTTPMAGAHGELTGIRMIKAWHFDRGDTDRTEVLVPKSAHGTNPATASMAGLKVVEIEIDADGNVDLEDLKGKVGPKTAGIMATYPSTLGTCETDIETIIQLVHEAGGLVYGDGANLNALLGQVKLGDLGFDVVHSNVHKTFSTPHGGGGPGAGPVMAKAHLAPYLPGPVVKKEGDDYKLVKPEKSIGRMGNWYGNFGILVRAYAYIMSLGEEGLKAISTDAVVNANYLKARLDPVYYSPYAHRRVMHEVPYTPKNQMIPGDKHFGTTEITKRLIDFGFHPPTVFFPLVIDQAMLFEPTESETMQGLDALADAMIQIDKEARENPDLLRSAPHGTPVGRLDEVEASRRPILRWVPEAPEVTDD